MYSLIRILYKFDVSIFEIIRKHIYIYIWEIINIIKVLLINCDF